MKYFKDSKFIKWFGESKIVDLNNQPMVMYHGSSVDRKFSTFNDNKPIWFTRNKSYAEAFIDKRKTKGVIFEVFLKIENPIYVADIDGIATDKKINYLTELTSIETETLKRILLESNGNNIFNITNTTEFMNIMINKGYDGIEAKEGRTTSFAVFNSNQIKSKTNKTFDEKSKNIKK